MNIKLGVLALSLLAGASAVSAADRTSLYVGGAAGGSFSGGDISFAMKRDGAGSSFDQKKSVSKLGITAGGFLGGAYQFTGGLILLSEVGANWLGLERKMDHKEDDVTHTLKVKEKFSGVAALGAGYDFGPLMGFVRVGFDGTFGKLSRSENPAGGDARGGKDIFLPGIMAGLTAEKRFLNDQVGLRADYDFTKSFEKSVTLQGDARSFPCKVGGYRHAVKIGAAWHFA